MHKKKDYYLYKGWKFTDFPKYYPREEYLKVVKRISKSFPNKKSCSLYHWGSLENITPGFSDLDLVFVGDSVPKNIHRLFDIEKMDYIPRYIIMHDLMYLSPDLFRHFGSIQEINKNRMLLISGKPIKNISAPTKVSKFFRHWDDIVVNIFVALYYSIFTRTVNIRYISHQIKFVKFKNPDYLKKEFGNDFFLEISQFLDQLSKLTSSWFNNPMEKNLDIMIELMDRSLYFVDKTILNYRDLVRRKYISRDVNGTYCLKDKDSPILFKRCSSYVEESRRIYQKYGLIVSVLPPELIALLAVYAKDKGPVSNYIRNTLNGFPNILKKEFIPHAKERINYYDRYAEFCFKNNVGYGPLVNFNQHIRPKKGLKYVKKKAKEVYFNLKFNAVCADQ